MDLWEVPPIINQRINRMMTRVKLMAVEQLMEDREINMVNVGGTENLLILTIRIKA